MYSLIWQHPLGGTLGILASLGCCPGPARLGQTPNIGPSLGIPLSSQLCLSHGECHRQILSEES